MALPLMPKATAVWLVENTSLTFEQIGEFCGLHALEVQAIADGEVALQMQGLDPVANGQLTLDEIEKRHILRTLDHTGWNKSKAAKILGIERSTLDRKINAYDLKK